MRNQTPKKKKNIYSPYVPKGKDIGPLEDNPFLRNKEESTYKISTSLTDKDISNNPTMTNFYKDHKQNTSKSSTKLLVRDLR